MSLRFWRRPPAERRAVSSPASLAVLEYDELGIAPQPGTVAAAAVGLRAIAALNCAHATVVDRETFGVCTNCRIHLTRDEHGEWSWA